VTMTFSPGGTVLTDASGNYTLTLNAPWGGTVTPSKANYTFAPASRTYPSTSVDQTAQNYVATAVVTISGQVTNAGAAGLPNVLLTFSGAGSTHTDASGNYTLTIPSPFNGTVTPSLAGFIFAPVARTYSGTVLDQAAQNFVATPVVFVSGQVVLGTAGLPGVTMTFSPGGTVLTDASGNYTMQLLSPWTGTITPSMPGYAFTPVLRSLTGASTNQTAQNFTAFRAVTIYGLITLNGNPTTPLSNVTVTFSNGGGSVVTDINGLYTRNVPSGWSGTVTPTLAGFAFTPVSRTFTGLTTNPAGQNFAARAIVVVSGQVISAGAPLSGVVVAFGRTGSVTTDVGGNYAMTLNAGWSGTVTPSRRGFTFSPVALTLSNVLVNLPNQNFITVQTISGRVTTVVNRRTTSLAGVTITPSSGTATTTGATGNYTLIVPRGWTGTLTPTLTGKTFTPVNRSFSNLITNPTGQNFTGQ
jgi:hypothetical protein